jgi:signal transduction histidine kinase
MALPIVSSDTAEGIGVLVIGFKPFDLAAARGLSSMKSGIWFEQKLHSNALGREAIAALTPEIQRAIASRASEEVPLRVVIDGQPHLLFSKALNAGSVFPPAYEICVYSLAGLVERQRQLRWQVLGAGALLLLVGLGASHVASSRLSAPVEKLAVDSERSARFSADASHQLKTPVTVMRAGLEELLANENLTPEECHQISALIHQTYRLSSLIEDLLLLSRMDAGRLKLDFEPVNLSELIEAAIDDLSALPDELEVGVETDFPPGLHIVGEKRYTTIILHNLLENARKYNRRGGRIRIAATTDGELVRLAVGNTGRTISAAAQKHIFERFHRGAMGENVPGYGLGLNLARELARLHQGDLRLTCSNESWTEFEVRFRLAAIPST